MQQILKLKLHLRLFAFSAVTWTGSRKAYKKSECWTVGVLVVVI